MQAPALFSPVSSTPTLGELADRLSKVMIALYGDEWSVSNMAHKMVIEMEIVTSDSQASDLARQVCDVLLKRAAARTELAEATSADLFTTPEAIVEKSLRELGIRLRSDCRDLTARVLSMLRGEIEVPPETNIPRIRGNGIILDSTGLGILHKARSTPRQVVTTSPSTPKGPSKPRGGQSLLPEERMYWKN